jgi:hypothetical protein
VALLSRTAQAEGVVSDLKRGLAINEFKFFCTSTVHGQILAVGKMERFEKL